ncbi:AprI/Inh family metalloprotease inhibitor [Rhizobium bangladeshense]|uniref:protease inhibitor Inh/omp19 family protein n=1 Tax=Rhizobium TaxID=379 RepID=UPI00110624A3|nr:MULTISPECIES: protease inhibitor Inh/omp19 family protein [Rhizobium]MBX4890482.1 AprI/Inh family metalloprotease inhibitor [Rhizobium bangladeshense]MBX4921246.1 AprI/Inh family metalloprotease inhibitor [Rhizobium bangladeshense]MBX4933384.1 AprI/Inh family metalloprotease inhibitor [Rhizobium bangladeshense]QSY90754.1 AprI/Inh family metalloprotease inhibitor [Rhizobium bangladeshense]QSY94201.1 AprI/Inh family metalloprotease inhibitor [Rhizobium bangladeshense]
MQLRYAITGLVVALALAGCQRTAYDYSSNSNAGPAPLTAQPVPSVQGGQLPPPTGSAQFPAAPTATAPMPGAQSGAMAANALDVTKESMVGSWRVNGSCDMFLTLTNLGSGSRGGTRGCVGELTAMGSWEVAGKQVLLKDRSGNQIGSVYKTADNRFQGQTNTGQQISLSR